MFLEPAILSSFIAISVTAHVIGKVVEKKSTHYVTVHHWVALGTAAILHPAVREGFMGYVIHFIIYSGSILPVH